METVRIMIVDDHELIINGLKDMLKPVKHIKIVGKALNGVEAVVLAEQLKPDVIFMDISMPEMNGIVATGLIKKKMPEIRILTLTQFEAPEYVTQTLKAGGSGYLLKNSSKEEFVQAIEAVMEGRRYFTKKISDQMLEMYARERKQVEDKQEPEVHLTKREKEIIQKIADELSNQQIADELHISLRTVETHRRNLMQKLKVNSVVSLLKYAAQHKLIKLN